MKSKSKKQQIDEMIDVICPSCFEHFQVIKIKGMVGTIRTVKVRGY